MNRFLIEAPTKCRECEVRAGSPAAVLGEGMFWIPSVNQWIDVATAYLDRRQPPLDGKRALWYCAFCFRKKALTYMSQLQCANCGVWDNTRGHAPIIYRSRNRIEVNGAVGNFKIVKALPEHLKDHDRLCMQCFETIRTNGHLKLLMETRWGEPREEVVGEGEEAVKEEGGQEEAKKEEEAGKEEEEVEEEANMGEGSRCSGCDRPWNVNDNSDFESSDICAWAQFYDDRIFSYGLQGTFKTSEPVMFPFPGRQLCNPCLKKLTYEPYKACRCGLCKGSFQDYGWEKEPIDHEDRERYGGGQGSGCCATPSERGLYCGYGSTKDNDKYKWATGIMPDRFRKIQNVCDSCLDQLLKDGVIEYEGEHNPWVGSSI